MIAETGTEQMLETTTDNRPFIRLENFDLNHMTCGWGVPVAKKTILDKPLTIGGVIYEDGVGTHSDSEFVIELNGNGAFFESMVGLDDEAEEGGTARFTVHADGRQVERSGHAGSGMGRLGAETARNPSDET